MATGRRRGPKPRGPFIDKGRTLTTRITKETRDQLERAARKSNRSLSQEIEFRLEQSFSPNFGGPETQALLRHIGSIAQQAAHGASLDDAGDEWLNDWRVRRSVCAEIKQHLDMMDARMAAKEQTSPVSLFNMIRYFVLQHGLKSGQDTARHYYRNFVLNRYTPEEQREFLRGVEEITGLTRDEMEASLARPIKIGDPVA